MRLLKLKLCFYLWNAGLETPFSTGLETGCKPALLPVETQVLKSVNATYFISLKGYKLVLVLVNSTS